MHPGLLAAIVHGDHAGRSESTLTQSFSYSTATGENCQVQFQSDGEQFATDGVSLSLYEDWWSPKELVGDGSGFEINCTSTGDSLHGSSDLSDGTWLSLSSNRSWLLDSGGNDTTTNATLTVKLRYAGTGDEIWTATIDLETIDEP